MKYIDLQEFQKEGYLQELNRKFLHPLGLALEVVCDPDSGKAVSLGGIWDCRDDPEGICFEKVDPWKADNIQKLKRQRDPHRKCILGYTLQPVYPVCPRCGKGFDSDGDGDCVFCAKMSDEELTAANLD